jgi:hypothetical protein
MLLQYHDLEWGVPVHNDRKHFEVLVLSGAQAGLSWSLVLKKREGYRRAGVIVGAKRARLVTAAWPLFKRLAECGLYLSPDLVAAVLVELGED